MMIRRTSVVEEPLLDEGYFLYGEEVDLTHRLRADGWRVVYFPGATIVHHHGGSATNPRIAAWVLEAKRRAWLRFFRKWDGVGTAWLANLIMLLGTLPRCLAWSASDVVEGLKSGSLPKRRSFLKSRVLAFHARALVQPALFDSSWEMKEETRPTERERT